MKPNVPSLRITAAFSGIGMLMAVVVFNALPIRYMSRSAVVVTPNEKSLSLTADTLIQKLASDPKVLASIITDHNLYPNERGRTPHDGLIDKMKHNIHVDAAPSATTANRTALFDIRCAYSDSYVAPSSGKCHRQRKKHRAALPVKIVLEPGKNKDHRLRPGLNVVPDV